MSTRSDQILERFVKFHKENPEVWKLFVQFTQTLLFTARKTYSADAVCHRIRWHYATNDKNGDFKINDHYTALYARLWAVKFPERKDFFRLRHRKSEHQPERSELFEGETNAPAEINPELEEKLKALL